VQPPGENKPADTSRAPRFGVRLMIIIAAALALLAIYANVQKARRATIEKVTIIPVATATPSPAGSGN
jgi:hypothetical protein